MKDPKDVVCLVVDNGLFCELAIKLAKTYKKVYYYVPWESAFPRLNLARIGHGIDELELVDSIYGPHYDEIDLFCFPDIYFGWEQEHLIRDGKTVWGSRLGECLELQREGMKQILMELDLPVGKYWHVKGMANLREFLKDHPNVYVKTDCYRGTFETFHSLSYDLVEPKLDEVEWSLGRFKDLIEFTVEAALEDRVEFGTDAWTIDGKFPSKLISGLEIKDCGFASVFKNYKDLPEPLTRFNDKMVPVFEAYGYRGFFSTEIRIGADHKPYMIDFCARAPSPPNELYQEQYKNLAECIWAGANGEVIDPEPVAKYGAEIMLHSSFADKNWQPVRFPDEIRDFVKLRNIFKDERGYFVVPQATGLPEIGAVVGLGDTLEEAFDHALENAELVEGYYLEGKTGAIEQVKEQIEKMDKLGLSVFNED
jgi:predicted RNase H-like HicB family nuclease